ncbi:cuticle protein 10.9-like [Tropilaelaps mercedesae]|uniref:Cuticle protein 10.9-like n=1 Tax=Tropilaelaps mercedesae TaxID=418985 RepID=A0A1V9XID7_9ACAR|nr:cuticle protein 10.9-like [Tropilaelaps mercedesae]
MARIVYAPPLAVDGDHKSCRSKKNSHRSPATSVRGTTFSDCTDKKMNTFVATAALAGLFSLCVAGHINSRRGRAGHAYDGAHGDNYGPPMPYEFSYNAQDSDGLHGHSQTSDGRTVRGHYMIQLADGHMRRVEYNADETGFHARIVTNELGTESKDAADAIYQSSAITGEQAALQYGPKSSSYDGHHAGKYGGRRVSKW